MIQKYNKEKNILDSRLNFPVSDEGKEIIEPYNEDEMTKWRGESMFNNNNERNQY